MVNFSILVNIGLDHVDDKLYEKYKNTIPDYSEIIEEVQTKLAALNGVEQVMFNHSSWMTVNLGVDDFDEAKKEMPNLMNEISTVFAKYGVEL